MRLPIVAAAVTLGLGLFCGSPQAARWLPTAENPYCDITTYRLREIGEQAMSMLDTRGRPVIVVNSTMLTEQPSYSRFLLAHECCHHTLGHVGRYSRGLGHVGPQPFFYIKPALRQMELDADCCAVRMLRSKGQADSIDAARTTMMGFGDEPTGAYYPTGIERAENMTNCSVTD